LAHRRIYPKKKAALRQAAQQPRGAAMPSRREVPSSAQDEEQDHARALPLTRARPARADDDTSPAAWMPSVPAGALRSCAYYKAFKRFTWREGTGAVLGDRVFFQRVLLFLVLVVRRFKKLSGQTEMAFRSEINVCAHTSFVYMKTAGRVYIRVLVTWWMVGDPFDEWCVA
jgi:hypothetical protein